MKILSFFPRGNFKVFFYTLMDYSYNFLTLREESVWKQSTEEERWSNKRLEKTT
jgi:hypothetical protein